MGDLIVLDERPTQRRHFGGAPHDSAPLGPRRPATAAFYFDLSCPFSYLAAERVERALGTVGWIPACSAGLDGGGPWSQPRAAAAARDRAGQRARELRIPLVWPERFPAPAPMALRAAAFAAECGSGMEFALAAARLAYCGGYDLEDPETLAEAAAAAGMKLDDCLAAAGAAWRDQDLLATARGLLSCGVSRLPAVRVDDRFFVGERRLPAAAAVLGTTGPARRVAPFS
jgi:2-hydroxychromene-2-carboxylate isomerase